MSDKPTSTKKDLVTVMIDVGIDKSSYEKYMSDLHFLVVDNKSIENFKPKYLQDTVSHGGLCLKYYELGAATTPDFFINLQSDYSGQCSVDDLVIAIEWCIKKGVSLISLSMGTTQYDDAPKLLDIIKRVFEEGICLIAGASNDRRMSYPGCFLECIGVCVDYTQKNVSEPFNFISSPLDGIDVVVNPFIGDGEHLYTNSTATAYFAGLVSKGLLNGNIDPRNIKKWISENAGKIDKEQLYAYTFNSILKTPLEDIIIISVQNMSTDTYAKQLSLSLQNLFLDEGYYCVSIFAGDYNIENNKLALFSYSHSDDFFCDYMEFTGLMNNLCRPNVVIVDEGSYLDSVDVIIGSHKTDNDDRLVIDIKNHTASEVFDLIVDFFQ